ncbi:crossover junction endodeoxyribonuclease RuvC [Pelagibius litoralis]|uniref:Crossover junction endodeoxyribonuclease RuvC n=1 Tax=Pelagibius litoralis TaxID=374515 RepID=A0A967F324_9PROT|nr:crossover junction endodeoxyribonuclease RuvC [Pelagibius litoralis]NIA72296.1 crossover junction endodeoxyribonuclease RuvC [Pelagibius litoralis]
MTALLCLDLATSTGFAFWRPGANRIASGSFRLPRTGPDVGWFVDEFEQRLSEMLGFHKPELVVFEAPLLRGGQTSIDTARKLMGLAIMTEFVCRRAGVKYLEANNASVRKHFIGKGRGERKQLKAMTIQACRERGWDPANDDEADALALLSYAVDLLRLKADWPIGGLFSAEAVA